MATRRRARTDTVRDDDLRGRPVGAVGGRRRDPRHRPDDGAADGLGAARRRRGRRRRGGGRDGAFTAWSEAPAGRARPATSPAIADGLEQRSAELAELIALEVGMPEDQCADDQIPVEDFRINAELATTYPFEERAARRAGAARAGRGRRRDHALELPAQPDRGQGRPGPRGRLHRGGQAVGGRPAQRLRARRDRGRGRAPARASSTWSAATARRSASRWSPTRTSTWSRSPGRPGPAAGSARSPCSGSPG